MITSITQALTPNVNNSPVDRTAAAASNDAITEARIQEAQAQGGATFDDPSLGSATIVDLASVKPKIEPYGELRRAQNTEAGRSMETIKSELSKLDAVIAKRRPELAGKWDFKLVDGKFKVTGVGEEDAKWLERKLNSNTALKGAAEAFVNTAVQNLQASDTNPPREEFNYASGHMENYTFYDVKDQLADKLSFRSMLSQSDQIFDSNRINLEAHDRGMSGLSVVASMLTASNQPVEGRAGTFYTTKYDPLQS